MEVFESVGCQELTAGKINGVVNTKNFSSIQAAIDSLPSTGGTVFIPTGTYTITSAINLNKNNIILEGEGKATIIYLANNSNCKVINMAENYTGCKLRNFKIDGNKANQTLATPDLGGAAGVYIKTQARFIIDNLEITNCEHSGIHLNSCSGANIINCYIHDCDWVGVYMAANCSEMIINNNQVNDVGKIGIVCGNLASPSNKNIISNNIVKNCTDNGINNNGSERNSVVGNYIENVYTGVCFDSTHNSLISSNNIYNTANAGIDLNDGSGGNSDYNLVIGNRIEDTTTYGILVNASGAEVIGNFIKDTGSTIVENQGNNNFIFANNGNNLLSFHNAEDTTPTLNSSGAIFISGGSLWFLGAAGTYTQVAAA
jgi:parallel beta-helix repeat protein